MTDGAVNFEYIADSPGRRRQEMRATTLATLPTKLDEQQRLGLCSTESVRLTAAELTV